MSKAYIFLADGFEEVEGLAAVDVLRRGGVEVVMVSMNRSNCIKGSHNIGILCDSVFEDCVFDDGDMVILPGGLHGTNALMAHDGLRDVLYTYRDEEKFIAAICAAPSVLGMNGILKGKKATCYPGFEDKLLGAEVLTDKVVCDGSIITGKGMGPAVEFGLKLLEVLEGTDISKKVADAIQY